MFPPGPYKNTAGLNSPHCICSIEEHGNITSRAFGKQLFGTKCAASTHWKSCLLQQVQGEQSIAVRNSKN